MSSFTPKADQINETFLMLVLANLFFRDSQHKLNKSSINYYKQIILSSSCMQDSNRRPRNFW